MLSSKDIINGKSCGHSDYVQNGIYIICRECGLVLLENKFVDGYIKRVYNKEEVDTKVHHEPVSHTLDSKRRTTINKNESNDKQKYARLSKQQNWNDKRDNPRSVQAIINIKKYLNHINFEGKEVIYTIEYVILKTEDLKLRGSNLNIYYSAILVYSFRLQHIPYNIRDLISFFEVKSKMSIFKLVDKFIMEYDLKKVYSVKDKNIKMNMIKYINQIFNIHSINRDKYYKKVLNECIYCLDLMDANGKSNGKSNDCNIAGIIYYILKVNNNIISVTENSISELIGVTDASLRRGRDDLLKLI